MIAYLFRTKKLKYVISRQLKILNNRSIPYWGQTYGGASVINGCVHVLGSTKLWKTFLAKFNATYDDLIQSYKDLYTENNNEKYKINLNSSYQNIVILLLWMFCILIYSLRGYQQSRHTNLWPVLNTVNKFLELQFYQLSLKKTSINLQEQEKELF